MLDFNDAPRVVELNPGLKPDRDLIAIYLDTVFSYCSGFIPLRGFVEGGRSHNVWVDRDNPEVLDIVYNTASYAAGAELASYLIPGTVAEHGQASQEHVRESQVLVCDIDTGAIGEKLAHAVKHLGQPTLIVESGGITADGEPKVHGYWKLKEAAAREDLETLRRCRHMLAAKIGADLHFASMHQPIRIAGSVYCRRGRTCLVTIREHNRDQYGQPIEYELADLHEAVMLMPALVEHGGVAALDFNTAGTARHDIADVLTRPVHEGGEDEQTRFAAISQVMGTFLFFAHQGKITIEEAKQHIHGFNLAQLKPPFDTKRVDDDIKRLWRKECREKGEPLPALPGEAETDPETFLAADLVDDPEPRAWVIEGWLPENEVTAVYGDGAVGKTLLAQLLGTCVATGSPWLGVAIAMPMPVFAVLCEDSKAELHRRQHALNRSLKLANGAAALKAFTLWSRVGSENLLVTYDRDGNLKLTPFYQRLFEKIQQLGDGPKLIILDTIADIYGGNEIDRQQVNRFVKRALGRLCVELECTVVILGHPSQSGMESGSGYSGSTAWNNAVRNRLYLERSKEDRDARMLTNKKANYSAMGDTIELRWHEGSFVVARNAAGLDTVGRIERDNKARALWRELRKLWERNTPASESRNAANYVTKVVKHKDCGSMREIEENTNMLLQIGALSVEMRSKSHKGGLKPVPNNFVASSST